MTNAYVLLPVSKLMIMVSVEDGNHDHYMNFISVALCIKEAELLT